MGASPQHLKLKTLGLPDDAALNRTVRAFIAQAGFTSAEFAEAAGVNLSSFNIWICGSYGKQSGTGEQATLAIRAKLKDFFDRWSEADDSFFGKPHYDTHDYKRVRAAVVDALREGCAYVIDGPPGTQKTYSFRHTVEEINATKDMGRAIYMRVRVGQGPQTFLRECCTRAGITNRGSVDQMIRKLRFFLGSQRVVLIIDEAQALSRAGLELVRQLLDEPPYFGVVLGGSHNLSVTLQHWEMEQWRSRLRRTLMLNGPSHAEAKTILTQQLGAMSAQDLDDTIGEARTHTVRANKQMEYISARALFDAITSVRAAMVKAGAA